MYSKIHIMNETVLGIIAGVLTSVSMLPQLIKVLKEKNAENLSWIMLTILILGLGLWVWYGVLKDDIPIIISNSFAVAINLILFASYWIYKK